MIQQVKVIRSISDVVAASRGNRCARGSSFSDAGGGGGGAGGGMAYTGDASPLRRVTEGGEGGEGGSDSEHDSVSDASSEESPFNKRNFLRGSFERIPILQVSKN